MKHDIAFLHTANVHIPTFQKLAEEIDPSIRVRHDVSEVLLSEALAHGITEELCKKIDRAMDIAAQSEAKVVVCTCSTIGGVAEKSPHTNSAISMRIDRAMADLAVNSSNNILVLAAVESTLAPTKVLLDSSSVVANRFPTITLELIQGAWPLFEKDEMTEYYGCIEDYINRKHEGYDSVILAQASMAPVAERFHGTEIRVLTSPELGVRSAIERFQHYR